MSKTTMGNKLPRKLEQKMKTVGEQIRLARLRRDLSVAQVAERATCSPMTVARIEKGAPTVAIGIYLRVYSMPCNSMMTSCCWHRKMRWAEPCRILP